MKKRLLFLIALLVSCFCAFASETKPLSVVVVGGGPTGLAAAIEAHLMGADVIVIEKRESYVRQNTLFLYRVTLDLFEKWNVDVPHMQTLYLKGERRGFVLIKNLEEGLAKRVNELGIKILHGEFKDFADARKAAVIQIEDGEITVPYDILVGADGANSLVREKLAIPCPRLAQAIAGVAMVPATNDKEKIGIEIGNHGDVFIKKVTIPYASVLLIQGRPDTSIEKITQKDLANFTHEAGWVDEAQLIAAGGVLTIESVPVYLQRAAVFFDPQKSAILLGDAAGCASFYRGMGANFALKTAEMAGEFFQRFPEETAYDGFNRNMEKAVDALIQDSMHLFVK